MLAGLALAVIVTVLSVKTGADPMGVMIMVCLGLAGLGLWAKDRGQVLVIDPVELTPEDVTRLKRAIAAHDAQRDVARKARQAAIARRKARAAWWSKP